MRSHLCCTPHEKNCHFTDFLHKSTTGSTSTCVFFLSDIPSLRNNFSYTPDPKIHHPAMDSYVLQLQCGNATAAFVRSKHRDIVAEVRNVVPEGWI